MLDRAQVTVRLDPELRRQFQVAAIKDGKSMQEVLHTWIAIYVRRAEDNDKRD
jgi:hypothetical protein